MKPFVRKQDHLQKELDAFKKQCIIGKDIINDVESDCLSKTTLLQDVIDSLSAKYDLRKQQQEIYGNAEKIFYGIKHDEHKSDDETTDDTKNEEEKEDNTELQWNRERLFVNDTSIPIVTIMGRARIGKSHLCNELLRAQEHWIKDKKLKKLNPFKTYSFSFFPFISSFFAIFPFNISLK